MTMANRSGIRATKTQGASPLWAVFCARVLMDHQGPYEGGDAEQRGEEHQE